MIASLVKRAREQEIPVMVVSGDRDVYQLVEDGVRVMTTSRGVTDTKIYDREGVIERYGVPPELVTDLIGLKGDTSDNIPGVPGIGDKTAAQLLQEYGDLEGVLANIDKISGAKRKENLTNHAEDARISKQLATAITDIDFELDLDELMSKTMDRSRLREVAREFELRVILQRLEEELGTDFVPEAAAEERLDASAEEGSLEDLPEGEIAVAVAEGTWAAADAKRIVSGEEPRRRGAGRGPSRSSRDRPRRQEPRGRRPPRSAGGGRWQRARPAPRHHGRRLPARSRTAHLRPLRHRGAARVSQRGRRRSRRREDDGQLELGEEPPADPAAEARLVWELAERQRSVDEGAGDSSS